MKLEITKIDRRHNGYGRFVYRIRPIDPDSITAFLQVREWCWEAWGGSCELSYAWPRHRLAHGEFQWCWNTLPDSDIGVGYIFLRGDEELAFLN